MAFLVKGWETLLYKTKALLSHEAIRKGHSKVEGKLELVKGVNSIITPVLARDHLQTTLGKTQFCHRNFIVYNLYSPHAIIVNRNSPPSSPILLPGKPIFNLIKLRIERIVSHIELYTSTHMVFLQPGSNTDDRGAKK